MSIRNNPIPRIQMPWLPILATLGLLAGGCRYEQATVTRIALPGDTVFFVPTQHKLIALTFDDGPNEPATSQILDILRAHGAPATFFVVGENVDYYPGVVQRMAAEGHGIGNHSYRHSRFDQISLAEIDNDIALGAEAIKKTVGRAPTWFRPPYGINGSTNTDSFCRARGLAIAGWSLDANDWNPHPVEDMVQQLADQVCPGDIILLHDGWDRNHGAHRAATVAVVARIVPLLMAQGYRFVSIPELLRQASAPTVVFSNGIRLLNIGLPAHPVQPGDTVWLRYFWDIPANLPQQEWTAFVHLTAPQASLIQNDHDLSRSIDVRDCVHRQALFIPDQAPQGDYQIQIGLCPSNHIDIRDRVPVQYPRPAPQQAVTLPRPLTVKQNRNGSRGEPSVIGNP